MEMNQFQRQIKDYLPNIALRFNEPLSKHTSFRIGGPAEVMAFPQNVDELAEILKLSPKLDIRTSILGAGTNVLAPDEGVPGLVICLKDSLNGMQELGDGRILVMAGVTMSRAAVFAANHGLTGMEFAHGIPGTIGGGVYMNAGAYGGEISQICESVTVINREGEQKTLSRDEMSFRYRHSILEESGAIVVSAVFCLNQDTTEAVKARMKELLTKRSASQPLDLPSAGSAFKRPVGGYAAALIDQAGLKGFRIGGAAISKKHAGFAVNLGGATANDVKQLLEQVSARVLEATGIKLEPEIRIW